MGTVRKTITLTDLQDQWIKTQIAAGHFTNDSEYIRDLIRRDRERRAGRAVLETAVQEGLERGVGHVGVAVGPDVLETAVQEGLERGPGEKTAPAVGDGGDEPLPDWQRDLIRDRLAALENVPPEERSVPWEAVRKRLFAGAK